MLLSQTEDYQKALQYAQEAQKIDPESPIPQKIMREIYLNLRKFEDVQIYLKMYSNFKIKEDSHQVFKRTKSPIYASIECFK